MCRFLNVSRSGYYAWCHRPQSARTKQNNTLLKQIKRIFKSSKETYGSPRVHAALKREGVKVSRKRVANLMKLHGLKARCVTLYRSIVKQKFFYKAIKNLRQDLPKPTATNQQWSADLTYIKAGSKWHYLAVVIDLYSRKVIGWSLGKNKNVVLTLSALRMAVRNRKPTSNLIFHTDRGAEYRAHEVQRFLSRHGMTPSMNRPHHCTDNAEVESFFHTLKNDIIKKNTFKNEMCLRNTIRSYIQHFYNRIRLHSSLNYCSPDEYERGSRAVS